jgi:hypothetical protein
MAKKNDNDLADPIVPANDDVVPEGQPRRITAWPPLNIPTVDVNLQGTVTPSTFVQGFWEYLRQRADAISYPAYAAFIERVLCEDGATSTELKELGIEKFDTTKHLGVDAYALLRAATEAFLLTNCGTFVLTPDVKFRTSRLGRTTIAPGELEAKLTEYLGRDRSLPFIRRIVNALVAPATPAPGGTVQPQPPDDATEPDRKQIFCDDLDLKVVSPCFVELIREYWLEALGVVQSVNAISLRFQNKRLPGDRDPLVNLETHPLRPLANLLWGYIQDEDHRLTVARRAYEYEHEYGLSLIGRAVARTPPADRRSTFLLAFHTLLHQAAMFYDRSSNLTFRADAFPMLNALREVHLILSEGAHNQYRALPWQARIEMLIQQWLLARRELREFVGGRPAVPYAEDWMRSVDGLRRLMGWGDTPATHFNDLATTGEKILLSVRFADWSDTNDVTDEDAAGWAVFWKLEIQRYIHSYQAVTGVDLSASTTVTSRQIDATSPSVLLQQRMARQRATR